MTSVSRVLRAAQRVAECGGTEEDLLVQLALEGLVNRSDVEAAIQRAREAARRGDEKAGPVGDLLLAALRPR